MVFRWNIARREQLGRLVGREPVEVHPAVLEELRLCCARVVAMAGDARLVFIGRSPVFARGAAPCAARPCGVRPQER